MLSLILVESRASHHRQVKYTTSIVLRSKKLISRLSSKKPNFRPFMRQSRANSSLGLLRQHIFLLLHWQFIDLTASDGYTSRYAISVEIAITVILTGPVSYRFEGLLHRGLLLLGY